MPELGQLLLEEGLHSTYSLKNGPFIEKLETIFNEIKIQTWSSKFLKFWLTSFLLSTITVVHKQKPEIVESRFDISNECPSLTKVTRPNGHYKVTSYIFCEHKNTHDHDDLCPAFSHMMHKYRVRKLDDIAPILYTIVRNRNGSYNVIREFALAVVDISKSTMPGVEYHPFPILNITHDILFQKQNNPQGLTWLNTLKNYLTNDNFKNIFSIDRYQLIGEILIIATHAVLMTNHKDALKLSASAALDNTNEKLFIAFFSQGGYQEDVIVFTSECFKLTDLEDQDYKKNIDRYIISLKMKMMHFSHFTVDICCQSGKCIYRKTRSQIPEAVQFEMKSNEDEWTKKNTLDLCIFLNRRIERHIPSNTLAAAFFGYLNTESSIRTRFIKLFVVPYVNCYTFLFMNAGQTILINIVEDVDDVINFNTEALCKVSPLQTRTYDEILAINVVARSIPSSKLKIGNTWEELPDAILTNYTVFQSTNFHCQNTNSSKNMDIIHISNEHYLAPDLLDTALLAERILRFSKVFNSLKQMQAMLLGLVLPVSKIQTVEDIHILDHPLENDTSVTFQVIESENTTLNQYEMEKHINILETKLLNVKLKQTKVIVYTIQVNDFNDVKNVSICYPDENDKVLSVCKTYSRHLENEMIKMSNKVTLNVTSCIYKSGFYGLEIVICNTDGQCEEPKNAYKNLLYVHHTSQNSSESSQIVEIHSFSNQISSKHIVNNILEFSDIPAILSHDCRYLIQLHRYLIYGRLGENVKTVTDKALKGLTIRYGVQMNTRFIEHKSRLPPRNAFKTGKHHNIKNAFTQLNNITKTEELKLFTVSNGLTLGLDAKYNIDTCYVLMTNGSHSINGGEHNMRQVVIINNGTQFIRTGDKDDIIIIKNGDELSGFIDARGGDDTLILDYNSTSVTHLRSASDFLDVCSLNSCLMVKNVNYLLGNANGAESLTLMCGLRHVDLRGGMYNGFDKVRVDMKNCTHTAVVTLRVYTHVIHISGNERVIYNVVSGPSMIDFSSIQDVNKPCIIKVAAAFGNLAHFSMKRKIKHSLTFKFNNNFEKIDLFSLLDVVEIEIQFSDGYIFKSYDGNFIIWRDCKSYKKSSLVSLAEILRHELTMADIPVMSSDCNYNGTTYVEVGYIVQQTTDKLLPTHYLRFDSDPEANITFFVHQNIEKPYVYSLQRRSDNKTIEVEIQTNRIMNTRIILDLRLATYKTELTGNLLKIEYISDEKKENLIKGILVFQTGNILVPLVHVHFTEPHRASFERLILITFLGKYGFVKKSGGKQLQLKHLAFDNMAGIVDYQVTQQTISRICETNTTCISSHGDIIVDKYKINENSKMCALLLTQRKFDSEN